MITTPILNRKLISPFRPGGSPTAARIPREWYHKEKTHIGISGPRDTGKSVLTGASLVVSLCLLVPGLQVCVVRKESSTLWNTLIYPVFGSDIFADGLQSTVGFRFNKSKYEIEFDNGSRIVFGGFGGSDAGGKILGGKWDVCWYNQIEREHDRMNYSNIIGCMIEGRAGNLYIGDKPHFLFIGDANPESPNHWWYKKRNDPDMLWYNLFHVDHPLFRDYRTGGLNERGERAREQLKLAYPEGWQQDRMVDGLWVGASGRIYPMITEDNFRPVQRSEIGSDWLWVAGIDYGHNDPNVCDWWAFSPERPDGSREKGIFYKSIYRTGILTETFVEMIKKVEAEENIEPAWRVSDHDKQLNADLAYQGIDTYNADKDVLSGLDLVRRVCTKTEIVYNTEMLTHQPDAALTRRGKSVNGMQEVLDYSYKDEDEQKGDGKDDYPAPYQDDHSMDVKKYVFKSVFPDMKHQETDVSTVKYHKEYDW